MKFVELCLTCHLRKPQTNRAPLKPIISSGFMCRGQVIVSTVNNNNNNNNCLTILLCNSS